jgi:6-phosphofructokinase 1
MGTRGNLVVGQSGGPTSVINGSLSGVIDEARQQGDISTVYGMRFAIEGFMNRDLIDLGRLDQASVDRLRETPSSALGSSRLKLKDEHFPAILEVLKANDIRYFHIIGGNDSMDTIHRVERYCAQQGYTLFSVGVPKTVDNDLFGTDHTPGFPSAARYTALSVMQSGLLARDMQRVDQYVIYQSIGRDAGWLTAAAALGKKDPADAPHILLLPERPVNRDALLEKVMQVHKQFGFVSIACGEGARWADGTPISASTTQDKFGNVEFGAMGGTSAALQIHRFIARASPDWRGEFQITESLPMCGADRMAAADKAEAYRLGRAAVQAAAAGKSGIMVGLVRWPGSDYGVDIGECPLNEVAEKTKPLPDDFIDESGFMVTDKFYEYMRPLVGPLPDYVSLYPAAAVS